MRRARTTPRRLMPGHVPHAGGQPDFGGCTSREAEVRARLTLANERLRTAWPEAHVAITECLRTFPAVSSEQLAAVPGLLREMVQDAVEMARGPGGLTLDTRAAGR